MLHQTKTVEISPSFISASLSWSGRLCFYLFIHLSLFTKSESSELLQEANRNVVDLLLEEHSEGVRLLTVLGRTVSNEKSAVLQEKNKKKPKKTKKNLKKEYKIEKDIRGN